MSYYLCCYVQCNIRVTVFSQVGYDMTKMAAGAVFAKSGHTPQEVDVVELHDCFSANELITYEGLGLCPEGKVECIK